MRAKDEKKNLERAAVMGLIKALKTKEFDLGVECFQDRPDAILITPKGERIGVEVTHIYCDANEAKLLLGREEKQFHGVTTPGQLCPVLKYLVSKKINQAENYGFTGPLWLLIRLSSPIWTVQDIMNACDNPGYVTEVFDEIWFLGRRGVLRQEYELKSLKEVFE